VKITFVTVCVGGEYVDYFKKIYETYKKRNLPNDYEVIIYTNVLEYCESKFSSESKVKAYDFRELLHFDISSKNYRPNDCIKLFSFCGALLNNNFDLLVYVDCDMMMCTYDEEEANILFARPGFYYELCHEYDNVQSIDAHLMKRIDQCKNVGHPVNFMQNENGKLIFPVERYWAYRRPFSRQQEHNFIKTFSELFTALIEVYKDDLYTEAVEMGHCFSTAFGNYNYSVDRGLTFVETPVLSEVENSELYQELTA